jgi:DNA-binding transcriptional LysR family regulator
VDTGSREEHTIKQGVPESFRFDSNRKALARATALLMAELRNFDLNLLVAFKVLMEEASVSRAAERMCISQSAMSHVLQRLRQQLDDPVLVRTPKGMTPTQRALALNGPICALLNDVERLIQPPEQFAPDTSQKRFVVAANDYVEFTLLPPLIEKLSRQAPNVEILVKQINGKILEIDITNADIDVAIGFDVILEPPSYLRKEYLFSEKIISVVRKHHPDFPDEGMSLDQFLSARHMLMSRRASGTGLIDDWLEQRGLARKISLIVPNFLAAPWIVARTDLVLSLPARIGDCLARVAPLKIFQLPISLPEYQLTMVWHSAREKEPAHAWFRQQIKDICSEIVDCPAKVPAETVS